MLLMQKYFFQKNAIELAETARFELAIPFWGIHTFQACSFNHSDTSPYLGGAKVRINKGTNCGDSTIRIKVFSIFGITSKQPK